MGTMSSKYDKKSLKEGDPPHLTSNNYKAVSCLQDILLPSGFTIRLDWKFEVNKNMTDQRGWMYKIEFNSMEFTPSQLPSSQVRFRKWQRMIINNVDLPQVPALVSRFLAVKNHYRSLGVPLIQLALSKYEFHIQYVMECERIGISQEDRFSSSNMLESDPPQWCSGPADNLTIDPTTVATSSLRELEATEFNRGNGWDTLHEFIFTLYPDKDSQGWQYNTDFSSDAMWAGRPGDNSCVRRRLWIRTCVRNNQLYESRAALRSYIANHRRGVIKTGPLDRQSHYRKRWCRGMAVLNDDTLELNLENNYQTHVEYSLKGCEVVSIESHDHPDKKYQFGMRQVGEGGCDLGLVCILNTHSEKERRAWMAALAHQIALVNLLFWPLENGPPTADRVLFRGEMWKRGHLVPNWKFRSFELRQGGTLAYFKSGLLRGKIRLRGCTIRDLPSEGEFAFEIVKNSGYSLALRTSDAITKKQWITALEDKLNDVNAPRKTMLPIKGK